MPLVADGGSAISYNVPMGYNIGHDRRDSFDVAGGKACLCLASYTKTDIVRSFS